MKILVDADACPVVDLTVREAKARNIPVTLITDTAHVLNRIDAEVITVEKGSDSADFKLVNLVQKGDLVVTQDYGLAAMVLAKGGRALNQNGMIYSEQNMDTLLFTRHIAKKVRMAGGRTKGPHKRTKEQDEDFLRTLQKMLEEA
ncbi:YaiI/YqxD family protein [uncultured Negativibacillus sp.]|uniref:YaiI/YqxD family protein n=1 Tax=uncultured Negativibacillus sp. TaxID=1980696 RepID=UPI0025ED99D5|nr:YaiI/YqxD family protein [uncultured Negativibacillus sp.]